MTKYTIGIAFKDNFEKVLLIHKQKPEWQKNKWNFLGGKVEKEDGEMIVNCVVREFKEECNLFTFSHQWKYMGYMENKNNWKVFIFVLSDIKNPEDVKSMTDEMVHFFRVKHLYYLDNKISNVEWLCKMATNFIKGGIIDKIKGVQIEYEYL
jgi:ADP-ribose pyrophosphatase YjhB (NUDIX family)